jgi:hypothetical protein
MFMNNELAQARSPAKTPNSQSKTNVIGPLASAIGIFVFITGIQSLPALLNRSSELRTYQTTPFYVPNHLSFGIFIIAHIVYLVALFLIVRWGVIPMQLQVFGKHEGTQDFFFFILVLLGVGVGWLTAEHLWGDPILILNRNDDRATQLLGYFVAIVVGQAVAVRTAYSNAGLWTRAPKADSPKTSEPPKDL